MIICLSLIDLITFGSRVFPVWPSWPNELLPKDQSVFPSSEISTVCCQPHDIKPIFPMFDNFFGKLRSLSSFPWPIKSFSPQVKTIPLKVRQTTKRAPHETCFILYLCEISSEISEILSKLTMIVKSYGLTYIPEL